MPLTPEQQAPVTAVATPPPGHALFVIAGPGSGKTSTLVAAVRAALAAGAAPGRIKAISFTNNSAAELKVRLHRAATETTPDFPPCPALDQVSVATFHAWVAQLDAQTIKPWTHAPVRLGPASLALALHLHNGKSAAHVFSKAEVAAAERHLEGCESFEEMWTRNFNKVKNAAGKNRDGFDTLKTATAALAAVLTPLQLCTHGTLMAAGPTLAATLPPGSLDWIFIDEAQDLNRPQHAFIKALQNRTGCRLFAIADDDQGIYKFRGASSAFLRDLEARATAVPPTAQKFILTKNFRSTPPIVDLARQWITPNWTELDCQPKALASARSAAPVLPVAILAASCPATRGQHAAIIFQAALSQGIFSSLGEAAILGVSPRLAASNFPDERRDSQLPLNICAEPELPADVLKDFLHLIRRRPAYEGDWHHALWNEFLTLVKRKHPDGAHGLEDLYACLEVFRRVVREWNSHKAAAALESILSETGFYGERPDPDYAGNAINQLSLHSSKGMEFRGVWLAGNGYTLAVKPWDENEGQPGLVGETKHFFDLLFGSKSQAAHQPDAETIAVANRRAATLENRRLLYVGLSRAADLLLISAPWHVSTTKDYQKQENAFCDALKTAADSAAAAYVVIETDADAETFAATLIPAHRHPSWKPPTRHRVESFTSLTRQPLPSEERVTELPPQAYLPGPQTAAAVTGDHFHRLMHLLALEPALLTARLAGTVTDAALIARVSTVSQPKVATLLASFFADTVNQPWTWFNGGHTEIPFQGFIPDPAPGTFTQAAPRSEILLKGFLDLLQTDPATGAALRLVDWKTGLSSNPDASPGDKHEQQLLTYARVLQLDPAKVELLNYYPATQTCIRRPDAPSPPRAPSPAAPQPAPAVTAPPLVAPPAASAAALPAPAPDPTAAAARARALLERCRPYCTYRQHNGQTSGSLINLAIVLAMSPETLIADLAPLQLARIPQVQIARDTLPPFWGVGCANALWLNI